MDKYEYKLRTEQMLEFMEDKEYTKAAEVADTIDWHRVRNISMLVTVGDIYEKTRNYSKSYEILKIVYDRSDGSRKTMYRLGLLALRLGKIEEAIDYYEEFEQAAPKDPNRYILKYKILRARKAPVEQQIEALEEFKKAEYIEKWAYELAKLYQEAGMITECLEECDDLILWFSEGEYVYKAMELKMQYKPLTPSQLEKYNNRKGRKKARPKTEEQPKPEKTEEEIEDETDLEVEEDLETDETDAAAAAEEEFSERWAEKDPIEKPAASGSIGKNMPLADAIRAIVNGTMDETDSRTEKTPAEKADALPEESEAPAEKAEAEATEETVSETAAEPAEADGITVAAEQKDAEEPEDDQIEGQMSLFDIVTDWERTSAEPEAVAAEEDRLQEKPEKPENPETEWKDTKAAAEEKPKRRKKQSQLMHEINLGDLEEDDWEPAETPAEEAEAEEPEQEIVKDVEEQAEESESVEEIEEESEPEIVEEEDETDEVEEYDEVDDFDEADDEFDELEEDDAEEYDEDEEEYDDSEEYDEDEEEYDDSEEYDEDEEEYDDSEEYDEDEEGYDDSEEYDEDEEGYDDSEDSDEDKEEEYDEVDDFEEDDDLDDYEEEEFDDEFDDDEDDDVTSGSVKDDREEEDDDDDFPDLLQSTAPLSRKETAKLIATGKTAPLPLDEISNALSMHDTGFIVHGRYDLETQSGVGTRAGLTEEQKKLFSYFVPVRGMSEQLVDVLEQDKNCTNREGTSRTGNLLVIGRKGSGKTVLAVDVVKAIQKQRKIRQGKVAIVTGESLNKKKIGDIFEKLYGGALIIEKAGKMNEKTVARLNKAMEGDTGEMLIVLEEQRKPLDRLLSSNREFRRKFTCRLEVPIFINDELVTFGQTYARENGYRIDEMGILALYSRIDALQREDHAVTVSEVKEVMDEAIAHSQKASAKRLVKRVFGRGTDEADRIILSEKDFNI